jgi:hypothetical protein
MDTRRLLIGTACALTLGACMAKEPASQPGVNVASSVQEGKDRVERSNVVTVTAIVEKVDVAKRQVTLRGPEGNVNTITVDESVRNLPQIHKGDEVNVAYYESVAIQLAQPGVAKVGDVAVAEGAQRAAVGAKPGATGARAVTVVTKVEGIDKTHGTITLKGPEGELKTIKAQNPANLDKVKVGDLLEITYTEAVAISVDKP